MSSRMIRNLVYFGTLLGLLPTTGLGGETPPPGPPWKLDFMAARREAMKDGKPIFMYFTKTV